MRNSFLALLTLFTTHVLGQNLDSGLVGFYPFNSNAVDSSALAPANSGTISGASFVECGVIDSAISFDGVNDYVVLDTNYDVDSVYSVSLWINPYTVHWGTAYAMRKQCPNIVIGWDRMRLMLSGYNNAWATNGYAGVTAINQLILIFWRCNNTCNGYGNSYAYTIPGLTIDTLCYTHVVITAETNGSSANHDFTVYVNGQPYVDTLYKVPPAVNLANSSDPFSQPESDFITYIGAGHTDFAYPGQLRPFHGAMDQMRVYDRLLTAAEALALYQEGLPADSVSLLFNDTNVCPGGTDTVWTASLGSCDAHYWMVNDSIVNSTDTFVSFTSGGFGYDTVSLIYSLQNLCGEDTIYQVFHSQYPHDTSYISLCDGDSTLFNGSWYNLAGTYVDTVSATPCDSVLVLQLSTLPTFMDTISANICIGETYSFGGNILTTSGVYSDSISNGACDTVHFLNLFVGNLGSGLVGFYPFEGNGVDSATALPTVNMTVTGPTYSTGVDGQAAFFDGNDDYMVSNATYDLDSSYTFSAWVKPTSSHSGDIWSMRDQCSSSARGWNKALFTISPPTATANGLLHSNNPIVTVYNQFFMSLPKSHSNCNGWADSWVHTVPGVSIDTTCWTHIVVVAENNWDSVNREFRVYINGVYYPDTLFHKPSAANLAAGLDPFSSSLTNFKTYFGMNHNSAFNNQVRPYHGGIDHVKIYNRAIDSCEAVSLYEEFIQPASLQIEGWDNITCTGLSDTLTFDTTGSGQVYDIEWLVNDSLMSTQDTLFIDFSLADTFLVDLIHNSSVFCFADTVSVSYVILPPDSTIDTIQICLGDSAFLQGAWQQTAGWYSDTLSMSNGCDSILVTYLKVDYELDTVSIVRCDGDSFEIAGTYYYQPGTYLDTITGGSCDTALTYLLTFLPVPVDTVQVTQCVGSSYTAGGSAQTQPGFYYDTLTAANGCDSVVVTDLQFEYLMDTVAVSICQGEVFQVNGINQNTNGYYPDTISGNNCDTVRYYHLTVIVPVIANQSILLCIGDSLQVGGAFQFNNGTYYDTVQSQSTGCDSVIITTLTFQYYTDTVGLSICLGEQIEINGNYQTAAGYYPDTLSGNPCDTLRYYHLTVISAVLTTQNLQLCYGDSFLAGGDYQNAPGVYYDSLQSVNSGCDSIVVTYIGFYYEQRSVQHTMCAGEYYLFYDDTLFIEGTYTHTAAGPGCDTLVTLDLDWIPPNFGYRELDLCLGDSIWIGGHWYSQPATVTDTLVSAVGCDSIRTSVLSFYQATAMLNPTICAGEMYTPSGASYEQDTTFRDTVRDAGCWVSRFHEIDVIPYKISEVEKAICQEDSVFLSGGWQTGAGMYPDTFTSRITGCDSIRWTDLTVVLLSREIEEITICRNDSFFVQSAYQSTSGTYYDTIREPNQACRTVIETHLTVLNMAVQQPEITILDSGSCPRPQFELDAGVNPPGIFWDNQENTRIIKTQDTGWIYLEYLHCNRRLRDSLYLPWSDCSCFIYIPNSFTPDDDEINDLFRPIHECPFYDYELTVFDRWGHAVFKTTDPFEGWDGKSYGIPSPIGAYAFHFRYRFDPEAPFLFKYGQVTLFR